MRTVHDEVNMLIIFVQVCAVYSMGLFDVNVLFL